MKKRIKNSKSAAIRQYITLLIFAIVILGIAVVCWKIGDTAFNSSIQNIEDFKTLLENANNIRTLEEVIGTFSILITLACGGAGIVILILSTIALILNLHNPSLKRWKIARILNLICTIIITFMFRMCYAIPIINIIVLSIIIFNIKIMFFYKPVNLIMQEESENQ